MQKVQSVQHPDQCGLWQWAPRMPTCCLPERARRTGGKTGIPFVGRAGQFLDQMLSIIGLSRRNCYIGNIVKCRPPNNRDPQETEQAACSDWLTAQIELMQPKIIVCLGRIAAMKYISPNFRITREHGTWSQKDGISYMAMYHPSALLRDPSKRPETFREFEIPSG